MPGPAWVVLVAESTSAWRDELEIHAFCYRSEDLASGAGNDIVVEGLTGEVMTAVGEAAVLKLAGRVSSDETRPVRFLAAHTPPPAMDAMRLQLCFKIEEWISACPVLTLAEFCQAHHCPAPSPKDPLCHGSPNTFYTLAPGGFLTPERDFAKSFGPQLLEFVVNDTFRVIDIQQLILEDKFFREFGGTSAADMVANMKRHRVLSHILQFLKEKDPTATWFLGLFMRGPPELVCLQGMQATAVVSASGRREVTEADIAREREQRMAVALASRYAEN
jgi:hypothetical protein